MGHRFFLNCPTDIISVIQTAAKSNPSWRISTHLSGGLSGTHMVTCSTPGKDISLHPTILHFYYYALYFSSPVNIMGFCVFFKLLIICFSVCAFPRNFAESASAIITQESGHEEEQRPQRAENCTYPSLDPEGLSCYA